MYLFGIKCPVCQSKKDMPVEEFSFDTREDKTCGIAYTKCINCDSRFEVTIPIIIGQEIKMRRLDQTSQTQTDELIQGQPHYELPAREDS